MKLKKCKRCNDVFIPCAGNQKLCATCRVAKQREYARAYYEKKHPGAKPYMSYEEREENRETVRRIPGVTFEFKSGKWWWHYKNGLTNGPFDTLGRARRDANKAF